MEAWQVSCSAATLAAVFWLARLISNVCPGSGCHRMRLAARSRHIHERAVSRSTWRPGTSNGTMHAGQARSARPCRMPASDCQEIALGVKAVEGAGGRTGRCGKSVQSVNDRTSSGGSACSIEDEETGSSEAMRLTWASRPVIKRNHRPPNAAGQEAGALAVGSIGGWTTKRKQSLTLLSRSRESSQRSHHAFPAPR